MTLVLIKHMPSELRRGQRTEEECWKTILGEYTSPRCPWCSKKLRATEFAYYAVNTNLRFRFWADLTLQCPCGFRICGTGRVTSALNQPMLLDDFTFKNQGIVKNGRHL